MQVILIPISLLIPTSSSLLELTKKTNDDADESCARFDACLMYESKRYDIMVRIPSPLARINRPS
uniref:Rad16 n=1 Tax=Phakopsora pachyrhizi TaxID=170000 RepID=A0A0S1MJK3_PHAPC